MQRHKPCGSCGPSTPPAAYFCTPSASPSISINAPHGQTPAPLLETRSLWPKQTRYSQTLLCFVHFFFLIHHDRSQVSTSSEAVEYLTRLVRTQHLNPFPGLLHQQLRTQRLPKRNWLMLGRNKAVIQIS